MEPTPRSNIEQLDRQRVDADAVRFLAEAIGTLGGRLKRIEESLIALNALVAQAYSQSSESMGILYQIQNQVQAALLSPEQKAEQLSKAKKIIEQMKQEAEGEIEMELKRRAERGIQREGDSLTREEQAAWEAGHELPQ